jgi:hypothetical protein
MNAHSGIPPSGNIALDLHLQPKQWIAFDTPATEVLYGGAAFGGKSFLMRVAAILWCSEIPGLQVYLFRRIRDDLIKNHVEGPKGFREMLAPWTAVGLCRLVENEIRFWNGAKIYLCHCEHESDVYKYQGAEIHVLMIDEVTHFLEPMYRFLRNRVRMVGVKIPASYVGRFPRILCGANPGNIGHLWVKNTFIVGTQPLKIRLMPAAEGGMLRQFIPARLEDNQIGVHDDPEYEARLEGLGSATLVAAMRWGDWDVIEGAFFDCWQARKHVIAPFTVPVDWVRFRSGDWGSASPTSIGWWAVVQDDFDLGGVQGGEIEQLGNDGWSRKLGANDRHALGDNSQPVVLPRGAIVRYREDYVASGPGKGLKLTAEQVADRIIEREKSDPRLAYAVLDPSTFKEDGGPSIAERINTKLVKAKLPAFRRADNARVTKIGGHGSGPMSGWDIVRQRMIGTGTAQDPEPTIFWFSTCLDSIRTIPTLQHDPNQPEDIDKSAEDHCFAAGTLVETDRGPIAIEYLPEIGRVNSLHGIEHYRSARMTRRNAEIIRLTFDDGTVVKCTKDHKFLVGIDEWRYARDLLNLEVLCVPLSSVRQSKSSMASATIAAADTFSARDVGVGFTERSGNIIVDLYRKAITSIILAITGRTMILATSNVSRLQSISVVDTGSKAALTVVRVSRRLMSRPPSGTGRQKELNGIVNNMKNIALPFFTSKSKRYAKFVKHHLKDSQESAVAFAQMPASRHGVGRLVWIMRRASALFAARGLKPIATQNRSFVPTSARGFQVRRCVSLESVGKSDVYCITVPKAGCFAIEGGIIVKNCADDARYACLSRPWLKIKLAPEPMRDAYRLPSEEIPSSNFKVM